MKDSAKHMMLVSMLFPALLLLGCNTPTGLNEAEPDGFEQVEPGGAPGQAVGSNGCFELDGEQHCADTEDPGKHLRMK